MTKVQAKQRGFTLLELLVVLVIMGFVSSYATPKLWQVYVKNVERNIVQKAATALQKIRIESRKKGYSTRLTKNELERESLSLLPTDWTIEKATTFIFLPTGVTNGGSIEMSSDRNNLWHLKLSPLDGRVKIERQ